MQTSLVVSGTVDGLHYWPNAPRQYSEFAQSHRHLFQFICHLPLAESTDPERRQVELWELRQKVLEHIFDTYPLETTKGFSVVNFGSKSCEGIADELLRAFGFSQVFVGEEANLGALVSN